MIENAVFSCLRWAGVGGEEPTVFKASQTTVILFDTSSLKCSITTTTICQKPFTLLNHSYFFPISTDTSGGKNSAENKNRGHPEI